MRNIDIKWVMTADPATIGPDDHIETACSRLEVGDIHHLPVVEDGKLVGVVSSSDLLKLHLLEDGVTSALDVTVDAIMEKSPITIDSTSSMRDAAIRLSAGSFHALPVVEPDNTLVGIVTTSDLIRQVLLHTANDARRSGTGS